MLEIISLKKSYPNPDGSRRQVLSVASFTLRTGEQLALRGPSGCGKSTLLHLVCGLQVPDSGSILLEGEELCRLGEAERDKLRAARIGLVFQTCNLLQGCTALENVRLGAAFAGGAPEGRAEELLRRVGLAGYENHFPRQLSLGQQQRVAVARALVKKPSLVLADEPTASSDDEHAAAVLDLLREGCAETGASLLLASHDARALSRFERVLDFSALAQEPRKEGAR